MNRVSLETGSRRQELLARCQQQRYQLIAATAAMRARFPRTARMAHWVRAVSRLLRVISASMRVP